MSYEPFVRHNLPENCTGYRSRKCTGYAFCQRFTLSKAAFALDSFYKRRKVRALSPPSLISRSHVAYVCKRAFSILPTHF